MKVGLVFDNQHRAETTGYYCRRALGPLVDLEHLLPHELDMIDPSIFDLFLFIDDGLDYVIPVHCRPKAAWAIDTHMDLSRCLQRFGDSDFLFAAQKNGAAALGQTLGRSVEWLPLACDPDIHRPIGGETKRHDVVFVGHMVGQERQRLLNQLIQRHPSSWFGQALFEEMSRMYSRGHVGFNCSVADDLNMRLFEIPACGIPLVTNGIEGNGLEELFDAGRHILTYRTDNELDAHIDRILNDKTVARQIANAGLQHVLQYHTYRHRMTQLLKAVTQTRTSVAAGSKSTDYFEFDRPDVRSLIPATAQHILDIGCASGRLGQALKSDRRCHVTGIEANSDAARTAATRLDRVICDSMETLPESSFKQGSFDCIVLADVLEHLRNPLDVLRKCRRWLTSNGSLVISVPNSRHHSVISGLIDGNWTYERAGLLDDDHVRCFTRRELEKLLYRSGFEIRERRAVPGPGYEEWRQAGKPGTVQLASLSISGLNPPEAEEFFIYQHLVHSRPFQRRSFGLTSIIVATYNQLWATRQCVDSILLRTDEDIELIFIDNGSTDGTPEYLQSIPCAKVILNQDNRGFAPAVNQGLRVAAGQQLLLLNNDCVVTTGWLDGLLEALHDNATNGLIGPVSNNVSGEQQISVSYSDLTSLDGFAWDRRVCRQLTETDRLVGFCLMFRREVMERIGLLDERFEIGCFEDDDFCRRARDVGYRAIIANHVFVHHFGSATFHGSRADFTGIMTKNEQRYRNKWSTSTTQIQPAHFDKKHALNTTELADRYSVLQLDDGSQLVQRKHVHLSLCMIVRDNEETIEACLDSIYPWVDEIIIVDTGSRDRTPEICRRFGARMFEYPWCDDFSAARNASLSHARGEWIFWMDSDDIIHQDQGRRLRQLVYGHNNHAFMGYVIQVHCPSSAPGQMTIVDHVKVFRNLPDIRFEHRIHEQILPAIRRMNGDVAFTDIFVVHTGSDQTPEVRERKLERDFRILHLDLQERPDHPFVLFNLGMTYEDAGEFPAAERHLRRCIEVSEPGASHLRKAWSLLVNSLRCLDRASEALETASTALLNFPGDKELLFRRAVLHQDSGNHVSAIADYEQILTEESESVFRSIDPAIFGHKAHHNLAVTYEDCGQLSDAIRSWQQAIESCPKFGPAWLGLGRTYLKQGDITQAVQLRTQMSDIPDVAGEAAIIEASVCEAQGHISEACQLLDDTWRQKRNPAALDELARILVTRGAMEDAVPVLEAIRQYRPDDASVLHNLGNAYQVVGRRQEAVQLLTRSLQLRPNAVETTNLLNFVKMSTEL